MKPSYLLVTAIGAAVAVAAANGSGAPSSAGVTAAAVSAGPAIAARDRPDRAGVDGEVLEVIQVPSYSYLRVGAKGEEGTWAAVSTTNAKVGDVAHVRDTTRMTDFKSAALGRTFPVIFFGALADGSPPAGAGDRQNPLGTNPHAGVAKGAVVDVGKVARAAGPNAATVAEVNGRRVELEGKPVRVHATVVKANAGILGKTFLHVRDGSGDAAAGANDLAVTTTATPAVGDTVTLEGVVVLDLDIGSGYKFPTIIENATLLTP